MSDKLHKELLDRTKGRVKYLEFLDSIKNPYLTADGRLVIPPTTPEERIELDILIEKLNKLEEGNNNGRLGSKINK